MNKNRKKCKDIGNNCKCIHILKEICTSSVVSYLIFYVFSTKENSPIFIRLFFRNLFKLDPDPHLKRSRIRICIEKKLQDPDLQKN